MIDKIFISQLKQNNVSKDAEKTKARISEFWKGSNSKQKKKIIELGNSNSSSIYRVTRLGTVSAKIVIAFAHICNVNPYYLTGETDELSECSNTLVNKFLTDKGYGSLLTKQPKKHVKEAKKQNYENTEPSENDIMHNSYEQLYETVDENAKTYLEDTDYSLNTQKESTDPIISLINLFMQKQNDVTEAQLNIIQTLSSDDIDYLIKALSIKSKAGSTASIIYKLIKLLLIS